MTSSYFLNSMTAADTELGTIPNRFLMQKYLYYGNFSLEVNQQCFETTLMSVLLVMNLVTPAFAQSPIKLDL